MKITKETVERMASLARLPVTADDELTAELAQIIEYMDAVKDAEGAECSPELYGIMREDEVVLSDMPAQDSAAFSVPKAVI